MVHVAQLKEDGENKTKKRSWLKKKKLHLDKVTKYGRDMAKLEFVFDNKNPSIKQTKLVIDVKNNLGQ